MQPAGLLSCRLTARFILSLLWLGLGVTVGQAAWFNSSWSFRKALTVSNPASNPTLTNYPVFGAPDVLQLSLIQGTSAQATLGDIRFTGADGTTELAYWLEDSTTNVRGFWVKIPTLPAGTATLYMYYGNQSASSASNGPSTFPLLFDDFSASSVDTSRWQILGTVPTISNGVLQLTGTALTGLQSVSTFNGSVSGVAVQGRVQFAPVGGSSNGGGEELAWGFWDGGDSFQVWDVPPRQNLQALSREEGSSVGGTEVLRTWGYASIRWLPSPLQARYVFSLSSSQPVLTLRVSSVALPVRLSKDPGSSGDQLLVDWILVRPSVLSEPSVTVLGSEERFAAAAPQVTGVSPSGVLVGQTPTVEVTLNQTIDQSSVTSGVVTLVAIQDRLGQGISQEVGGTPTYQSSTTVRLDGLPSLSRGVTYEVRVKNIRNLGGIGMSGEVRSTFRVLADQTQEHRLNETTANLKVVLPAGALGMDYGVSVTTNPLVSPREVALTVLQAANQNAVDRIGAVAKPITAVELNAYNASGQRLTGTFATPATVTLGYADAAGRGLVDGTSPAVRVRTLGIWALDEGGPTWVRLPSSVVDTMAKTVSATVTHFSAYALMGIADTFVEQAHAYPVPFQPSRGHTRITFTQLPSPTTIRIYTLDGELVRTLNVTDGSPTLVWDVKNGDGEAVASGVYLYRIQSSGSEKTGKLVIIR